VTVYLVGAGPGDPGLLTVRGAEVLSWADVVVHDRLSEVSLLDLAPPDAERIDVGKRPGGPVDQNSINRLLVEKGSAGLDVVRLKGGDPFVFGRGGEEAQALLEAGVPFEVVPGITSAVAVPAYAGIPVTHRGLATSFTVVTGHSRHEPESDADWDALARSGDTIVVLMGVAHRAAIAESLMAGGLAGDTPVAAVRWGTRPEQSTVRTTLAGLGQAVLEPPATIVIGQVASLDLRWFEARPLFGVRVVVTRAREQASELSAALRDLGAAVVEVPAIAITDPPPDRQKLLADKAQRVGKYDWVVFTSANAVARFMAAVGDARRFGSARIAAVGPGTAEALTARSLVADLVPERSVAESLVAAFPVAGAEGGRVLLPRAAVAREVVPDGLRAKGWEVDVVEAYRTVPAAPPANSPANSPQAAAADVITFTSSSTVTNYVGLGLPVPPVVACIGPVTAQTARDCGLAVDVVAEEHTIEGLIAAVRRRLGR
jgi:uroporphyrinogen III methyltransferase/synthase